MEKKVIYAMFINTGTADVTDQKIVRWKNTFI